MVNLENNGIIQLIPTRNCNFPDQKSNRYVETAITFTLSTIAASSLLDEFREKLGFGIKIVIVGHNDFYSQREELLKLNLPLISASLSSLPYFCSTHTNISEVHKTGLGSSAAMITSLVGSLISYFCNSTSRNYTTTVHNLSQFCHCLAQGKIGSGFDISSACFGSHEYKRFDPSILDPLMAKAESGTITCQEVLTVVDSTNKSWDNVFIPSKLPPGIFMRLADIDAGSSTPKLVSKVLTWRKTKPNEDGLSAKKLWLELDFQNRTFISLLRKLSGFSQNHQLTYDQVLSVCSKMKAKDWTSIQIDIMKVTARSILETLIALHNAFQFVRKLLRKMSLLADVPIEPIEQTELLDSCQEIPGVFAAGVPGAGGFDAIVCLTVGEESSVKVEEVWKNWGDGSIVGPLLARESKDGGVKIVNAEDIDGLKNILDKF
ncbi:phosphomevalonate kinase [Nowakowskiella sp. JEL0078]|nr:phosphomevalonate kinase [Nowakowskiella sp. JEL0078]